MRDDGFSRRKLRKQRLRSLRIWVPDTRLPKFRAEAARQSRQVAQSTHAAKDQAFVDAVSEVQFG